MTSYYVFRLNGVVQRIAKIVDGVPYGYENGKWEFMPGLAKIQNDATSDYEEITKEEADILIQGDY